MKVATLLFLLLFYSVSAFPVSHSGKKIDYLQSSDTRECVFFRLVGVAEADPVVPANPWFAIPLADIGFEHKFSMLLTAKTTDTAVDVVTTGVAKCGHAEVKLLIIR